MKALIISIISVYAIAISIFGHTDRPTSASLKASETKIICQYDCILNWNDGHFYYGDIPVWSTDEKVANLFLNPSDEIGSVGLRINTKTGELSSCGLHQ